ncbi:MAG: HIT family protein, partial [Brucellaceae bacterium]|nr:HIT family protein [Brucellaceae bacterium]
TVKKLAIAAKKGMGADGVTIQQFSESAGGQIVFHLHVHIIPRFEGVALKRPTGDMEDNAVLAANAEKIRAALG